MTRVPLSQETCQRGWLIKQLVENSQTPVTPFSKWRKILTLSSTSPEKSPTRWASHRCNRGGDEIEELIDKVHAPVVSHAAAVQLMAAPAVHGSAGSLHPAFYKIGPADRPLFQHPAHDAVIPIPAGGSDEP